MAGGVLASSPSGRDGVVTPTRSPDGSLRPFFRFENKNPRAVFWRGTDRLPLRKHAPNPRNSVLHGNSNAEQRT